MRKGKHVLTEKLMAHDVAQCKEMARAAANSATPTGNPIVFAVGHQRHYSILYDNAVDQIKQGLLGRYPSHPRPVASRQHAGQRQLAAAAARRQEARGRAARAGNPSSPASTKTVPKPIDARSTSPSGRAKIAQKQAQINDITNELAEKYGYQAKQCSTGGYNRSALEELIRWRLWDRTGGGLMAELGSHQLDAASIFITAQRPDGRKAKPLSVVGVGGRSLFPADRDCDDHVYCIVRVPRPRLLRRRSDAHKSPIPTRKSSSPIRRSTATASAAGARSCSAPRAR